MSSLAQLEARVSARLADVGNVLWNLPAIDEGIRTALSAYTDAIPQADEGILILPGTGREIALDPFANLIAVLNVWWPFDTITEQMPPNQVAGYRLWWDDARPLLYLNSKSGNQPQINDTLRLWYTKPHTIQNLDGGTITTVFPNHETGVVGGAAGYCALMAIVNEMGSTDIDVGQVITMHTWGNDRVAEFQEWLDDISANAPSSGAPYGEGWSIDKWDTTHDTSGQQPRPWPG